MKILYIIILFLMLLPTNVLCDEKISVVRNDNELYLNDIKANEYKKFLNNMRKTDKKRVFLDYKEDRDTRYRKLRESAEFEAREAEMLSQRLWEQRYADRWDRQSQLIEKAYSGSQYESDRAVRALRYGYPGRGGRQIQYNLR
ncbi:MAG TPA: hypothetical protein PK864_08475 [Syntrophorhabdaceae bacterium]|nr:hypothetical protein [Syntrophorhabdaceae bacterium]HPC67561.1 hypothetical protein [Syntrophorhabdaceae bacterium]HQH43212.1 hypothetical protein [Syntrophorhabdaceae bacterium]HRV23260.1 hypothetical protein [Syntrophorhabdaceae bacterium]